MLNIQRYTAILLSMVSMCASFGLSIEAQLLALLNNRCRVLSEVTNEDIPKIGVDELKKYIKEIREKYQVKESDRVIVELKPVSNQGPSIYITDRVFGTDYNSKGLYIFADSNNQPSLTREYELPSDVRIEKIIIVPDVIVPPVSDEGGKEGSGIIPNQIFIPITGDMRNLSIGDIYLLLSKQLNSGIAYLAFNGITGHDNSTVDYQALEHAWEGGNPKPSEHLCNISMDKINTLTKSSIKPELDIYTQYIVFTYQGNQPIVKNGYAQYHVDTMFFKNWHSDYDRSKSFALQLLKRRIIDILGNDVQDVVCEYCVTLKDTYMIESEQVEMIVEILQSLLNKKMSQAEFAGFIKSFKDKLKQRIPTRIWRNFDESVNPNDNAKEKLITNDHDEPVVLIRYRYKTPPSIPPSARTPAIAKQKPNTTPNILTRIVEYIFPSKSPEPPGSEPPKSPEPPGSEPPGSEPPGSPEPPGSEPPGLPALPGLGLLQ